jgi:hypothetical protein
MKELKIRQTVRKVTGDYVFEGYIVSKFKKRNGMVRYVVENYQGILHIFSRQNLEPI